MRLHAGPAADSAAKKQAALAFTVGRDVVLSRRGTQESVLAHELAHVVQQKRDAGSVERSAVERSADHGAANLMRGAFIGQLTPAPVGLWRRGDDQASGDENAAPALSVRALTPHFNPAECASLFRIEDTDLSGPFDAPPGKFTEVWAEFCVPRPRLDDPERGIRLPDDRTFGEFTKGDYIRVQRYAAIRLDGGLSIEFALRGFQRTKANFTEPKTLAELEALLDADGTSAFELEITADVGSANHASVLLVGTFEQQKLGGAVPGLHSLMRNVDAREWAKVVIPNRDQYRRILSRLLRHHPYLNRFSVSPLQAPPSQQFDDEASAVASTGTTLGQSPSNKLVTRDADGKYHVFALQPMDLFWLSEAARRNGWRGDPPQPRYDFLKQKVVQLQAGGRTYRNAAEFADAYYFDVDAAQRGHGGAPDALVYETGDGFYGRYALKRQDALDWWRQLDKLRPEDIATRTVRHFRGYDLGRLHSLYVHGQASAHSIDAGYLAARDRFAQRKQSLGSDFIREGGKDYAPISWWVLVDTGHADNFRYLLGELDRPNASGGTLLGQLQQSDAVTRNFARFAWERVANRARAEALPIVESLLRVVTQLGSSEEQVRTIVLAFPNLDAERRKAIVQAFGIEEANQEAAIATLSDVAMALDIYRGLEVGGISVSLLLNSVAKSRVELGTLRQSIVDGTLEPVTLEGEFGDVVRERAYRSLGFAKLRGSDFPHRDSRGLMPDYLAGESADSADLLERIYGNYTAAQATAGTIVKVIAVAGAAIAGAFLIWITGGLAAYLAEAFFAGSATAEVLIGAALFTGISEGLAQALGQGALNSKDRDFGLSKLGLSFLLNVMTFGIFRGLNMVMKGWTLAARLGTTGASFLALSVGSHMLSHGGKLPQGAEWGWLIYESTLMFVLLEAGGYFGRDAFTKMQIAGRNVRAGRLASTLEGIRGDADILRLDYTAAFKNTATTRGDKLTLADRYIALLERQQSLLRELGSLPDVEISLNVARELSLVEGHLQAVRDAAFLLRSGLRQLGSQTDVFTYAEGKEGAGAIRNRFGAANVSGPDADGVISLTQDGKTLLFLPERASAGSRPGTKKVLDRPGIRRLAEGVLGVEPRRLDGLKAEIQAGGGNVRELKPGHYAVTFEGESFVLVSEASLRVVPVAREAAAKQPGGGRELLIQSMRSDLAVDGLKARLDGPWKDLSEAKLLDAADALEKQAVASGRTLNDILEGEALVARVTATKAEYGATGKPRTARIAAADAHIAALRRQIEFLSSLEAARMLPDKPSVALEKQLGVVVAERGELVLHEAQVAGSPTLHTYEPGPEARALLEARYGAANVRAGADGVFTVQVGAVAHTFVPTREGLAADRAVAVIAEAGPVRPLSDGMVAVESRALRGLGARVLARGGTWVELGNEVAVATLSGQTVVVVGEGALRLVPDAQAAEAAAPGQGLRVLRAGLRSDLAREGLDGWLTANRGSRSDAEVLADLKKLEEANASAGRNASSLHTTMERAAQAVRDARARLELLTLLKNSGFAADPWVQRMIASKNVQEITGVLAERRVSQLLQANPGVAGRNIRIIDKVWVMALIDPTLTRNQWLLANPRPARAAFSDAKAFDAANKAWAEKAGSVKDLPGGGVAEQVKDIDHLVVDDTGTKLEVKKTVETKYQSVAREALQAEEAYKALQGAVRDGLVNGRKAVVARSDGIEVKEILTDSLSMQGPSSPEVAHPDMDVQALAKEIIQNPLLINP